MLVWTYGRSSLTSTYPRPKRRNENQTKTMFDTLSSPSLSQLFSQVLSFYTSTLSLSPERRAYAELDEDRDMDPAEWARKEGWVWAGELSSSSLILYKTSLPLPVQFGELSRDADCYLPRSRVADDASSSARPSCFPNADQKRDEVGDAYGLERLFFVEP